MTPEERVGLAESELEDVKGMGLITLCVGAIAGAFAAGLGWLVWSLWP